MNIWDIAIILAVAAAFISALRKIIKDKREGRCCGECGSCAFKCKSKKKASRD